MTGFITVDTNGRAVIDSHVLGRSEGTSAQTWAGPAMAAGTSLVNAHLAQAHGNKQASDARPGFLAAGMPGGHNAATRVPGGAYTANDQLQTVAPSAGQ